jgi:5-formyltetrahydrofolate cyclo-ligase
MDPLIKQWRQDQRARLLAQRRTIAPADRQRAAQVIGDKLSELVAADGCATIGLFWPIKQEINLLPWSEELARERKVVLCLPVVVQRGEPLEYWRWRPGEPLQRGFWDIPIPATRDVVVPDLMLAPLVGFDRAKYRLGYGGGYFDRTLASLPRRPIVAGVGFAFSELATIFPQPHDIPLDVVLTETIEASSGDRSDHVP